MREKTDYKALAKLAELLKQGDRNAFNQLYQNYWRKLFSVAYQSVLSVDDAKDLVQDTFVKLWDKKAHLDASSSVSGLLFTILKNNIINHLKKEMFKKRKSGVIALDRSEVEHSPEDYFEAGELAAILEEEIDALPPKMKNILVMSRQGNMSVKEIADALNIAPRTVKNQISNALSILRAKLQVVSR